MQNAAGNAAFAAQDSPNLLAGRDESDLDHAGVLRVGHDRRHELILGVAIRLDVELGLLVLRLAADYAQLRLQGFLRHRLIVPEQLAAGLYRQLDRFRRRWRWHRRWWSRLRQVDRDLVR